ncbi:polysaccharide deacetylase family protein [Paenibacillus piri]|uniref:Polysaccharide deacetylase family protein n=1 Tax=Paenibacillus piri TaxID=2547395 RepID=A0A4R5KAM3_9BACL|nr:polysaccharide deacetylase family protein [Paenibacillus piri]TDF92181.1 polysaccharide deacetylase family protein [Paenibacillus piri]
MSRITKLLLFSCALPLILFVVYRWGSYSYKDQVAVLAYHHLSDKDKSNVTITPELFRNQLALLKSKGYHFMTLDEFRSFMDGGPAPKRSVLVTFDDGYESFYTYGYPILKELRIPAVNFVVTKDLANPKAPKLAALSKDEIREMSTQTDTIEFQCHSHELHTKVDGIPALTSFMQVNGEMETDEAYRSRVVKDTQMCINSLTGLRQKAVDMYAYPFGDYSKEATELLRQAGIRYAFTVVNRTLSRSDDPMHIPRVNAGNPSITPEALDRMIMRRAVTQNLPFLRKKDTPGG